MFGPDLLLKLLYTADVFPQIRKALNSAVIHHIKYSIKNIYQSLPKHKSFFFYGTVSGMNRLIGCVVKELCVRLTCKI